MLVITGPGLLSMKPRSYGIQVKPAFEDASAVSSAGSLNLPPGDPPGEDRAFGAILSFTLGVLGCKGKYVQIMCCCPAEYTDPKTPKGGRGTDQYLS